MEIMIIADTHGKLCERQLQERMPRKEKLSAVFLLGDIFQEDIDVLKNFEGTKDLQMFGIIGNHDISDILKINGIKDLHLKTVDFNGYKIGGFGGSIRYRNDMTRLMYTNPQSEQVLSYFEPCDILLTHDKPCFKKMLPIFKNMAVHAHSGLTGIAKYIKRCSPKYAFHGHMHDRYSESYYGTSIRCCYGVEIITIPDKEEERG